MDPISLTLGAIQLGTGLYSALKPDDLPGWLTEDMDYYRGRLKSGMSSKERSELSSAFMPKISRGVNRKLSQTASRAASRGRAGASYTEQEMLDVPSAEEIFAPIEMNYDMQAREGARNALSSLYGLRSNIQAGEDARQARGWGTAAGGLMTGLESFKPPPEPSDLEKAMTSYFSGGAPKADMGGGSGVSLDTGRNYDPNIIGGGFDVGNYFKGKIGGGSTKLGGFADAIGGEQGFDIETLQALSNMYNIDIDTLMKMLGNLQ